MKRTYLLAIGAMLILLAAGAAFTFFTAKTEVVLMRESLLNETRLAQSAVNWRRIQSLTGTEADLVSPDYLRLKEMLIMMRATHPQCRFMYVMGRKSDGTVNVDPSQIDQILANLSVNARDAISGVGNLSIETENVVFDETYCANHLDYVPGDYVMMAVSDTGSGMDAKTLEQVFDPFFTTKETGKGTGLGLATVYGAVRQNNGFINVYSEPGHGTSFKIYLPRVQVMSETDTVASEQKTSRGTETVLLAEDEATILKLGKTILERYGYTVLTASTPWEAIALAEEYEGPIHMLVTDVVMPGMNGRELRDKLAVRRPEIKTMFMSGYTADVIAHHGVIDEGVQFLQKPFSVNTLVAKVREVLDQ